MESSHMEARYEMVTDTKVLSNYRTTTTRKTRFFRQEGQSESCRFYIYLVEDEHRFVTN